MTANTDAPELRSVDSSEVIKGVVALLFTPFSDDGTRFDAASMRRQIDFVLEPGARRWSPAARRGSSRGRVSRKSRRS